MKPSLTVQSGLRRFIDFFLKKRSFLKNGLFWVGALCLILLLGLRYWMVGSVTEGPFVRLPTFLQSDFWWNSALSLLETLTAFLMTILAVLFIFFCSAFSRRLRVSLRVLMAVLGVVPMIALIGMINLVLNDFLTTSFLAASMLVVRSSGPALKIDPYIPSLLLKSAKAMRLKPWQQFWKLHVPIAYPAMARSIALEMPHFWIRFLGAEGLLAFLHPARKHGLGGYLFLCLKRYDLIGFCEVFCVIVLFIGLVHIFLIKPLFRRINHYDVSASLLKKDIKLEGYERPVTSFWKNAFMTILLCLFCCFSLSWEPHQFYPLFLSGFGDIFFWGASLGLALLFWVVIGGITLNQSPTFRARARSWAYISSIIPFFLCFPLVKSLWGTVILLALTIQGAFGASVFYRDEDRLRDDLINVAYRLRLSSSQIWQHVRLPLLAPSLARGTLLASYPLWDLLLLGGALLSAFEVVKDSGSGQIFLTALQTGDYSLQAGIFFLVTAFSYGLSCLFLSPLGSRIHRKFRMHP